MARSDDSKRGDGRFSPGSATQSSLASRTCAMTVATLLSRSNAPWRTRENRVSRRWASPSTALRSTARAAPLRLWGRRNASSSSPPAGCTAPLATVARNDRICSTWSRCSIWNVASSLCRISFNGSLLNLVSFDRLLELLPERAEVDGRFLQLAGAGGGLLAGLPDVANRLHHLRKSDLLLAGPGDNLLECLHAL